MYVVLRCGYLTANRRDKLCPSTALHMVVDLALLMLASQFEYTAVISVILGQRCLPDLLVMGFYCRCYPLLSPCGLA